MPIKGENIYKRKDRRWEARYILSHRPDGSIHYGYCYGKTYREAKQKLENARAASPLHPQPRKTLAHFCDEWLQLRRSQVKESTFAKYHSLLERHIKPGLGSCPISELTGVRIEQFSHQLLHQKGLSPKTVRDILTVLHGVLRHVGFQCPGGELRIAYPHSTHKEMRMLTPREQQRLVCYLRDQTDLCSFGVLLTLMTGIRIGELCALRWKDISLEQGTLRVGGTMQRIRNLDPKSVQKTRVVITAPKSGCSFRIVPLTDQAAALCRAHLCGDPEAYVLTGSRETYMEPRALQYRFQKYASACGLEGVHFHTLRHTFATRCVEAGFEIKTLSEIMGHASPKITLERYVHSSMELKRENMRKLRLEGL
ncbi:MAG: site-specific integrase [Ruminococcaceae bacterium]|nr:site-specific integrase [Oscillospiraceae bacterium]